ncbi:beta-ketoacyl synthase N-terminal-like domain-containing protein, partial [Streptomyces sp. NPDC059627]
APPPPAQSGGPGFRDPVDAFDAEFFGLSPREACRVDPHQRLVMELGWESLEDAGLLPATLRGGRAAVVIGMANDDWQAVLRTAAAAPDLHSVTGGQRAMVAGRLSHFLGVNGPSLTVDTGQSSSLTAVHTACRILRSGEAESAIAGGVSLMLDDAADEAVAATGAMSPRGRCRVLDAGADGFVRGEGGGLVVLKPLAAALADGDRIRAVLRGSALGHDGGEAPLTVPDAGAQQSLLRAALADARTDPADVGYVELHGTGTVVGDPVEAEAVGAVLGAVRSPQQPLRVGSAKSNLGHLEAAAGIAGLIKAVLAVEHGLIPATLHFSTPSPRVPLDRWRLSPQITTESWPDGEGTRIAGVSSFGMSGTNCHVVVAEAPPPVPCSAPADAPTAWPLSARTPAALRAQAAALRDRLVRDPDVPLTAIAVTLARHRTAFKERSVIVGSGPSVFLRALDALARGTEDVCRVIAEPGADPGLLDLADRFIGGETVDWPAALPAGARADLPTYPFQRSTLWPVPPQHRGRPPGAGAEATPAESAVPHPSAAAAVGPVSHEGLATLDVVRRETAAVLGHGDIDAIEPDLAFRALGTDSLTALELVENLTDATGMPLPSSLLFDHPTPRAVAAYLDAVAAPTLPSLPSADNTTEGRPGADPAQPGAAEPIAVVGIGCRFPGGIHSADDLWDLVAGERDVIGDFPTDRGWDLERLFSDAPDARGTSGSRRGGFLHDAAGFDAAFFGISPREALAMDPQQRLLLEVGWEAVEHAGLDPLALRATPTGVFIGAIPQQYDSVVQRSGEDLDGYVYTGSTTSLLAGRLAYVLGLQGPALAVDTACSSSLAALHLAGRSLRAGECSLALAGGVTIMSTPTMFTDFTAQGALSPDGRSKAFGAEADGTGWSEGVGVLVLERLGDARRNGHRVLAVIRGSALNEDGASNGLTAPNGPAQQRVIHAALADAALRPDEIDAVEAHGPGTRLGDPIEVNALLATYGADRPSDRPLWLGSVKSNLGHTQAAAGVAGVIKMVMALRHATLPRTLNADRPSPHIDWSSGTVRVLSQARPWPTADRPPRAGDPCMGAGGTNPPHTRDGACALPPPTADTDRRPSPGASYAFPLSARTTAALAEQARRLHAHLTARPTVPLADIAHTLGTRPAFTRRAVVTADDRAELLAGLTALAEDPGQEQPVTGGTAVFVFPGQGSQWPGMAAGLLDHDPVFTASAEKCAAAFGPYLDWSVLDVLRQLPGAPPLDRVDVAQPALFTVMVSLAALWRAHGVEPAAVIGHSQGEIAAAYVAGALSLEDAARIIALRSQALLNLYGHGAMAAVSLPAHDVRVRLRPHGTALEIAAVNGPASTTVGGDPEALTRLLGRLDSDLVRYRRLPGVSNAGHSSQIEPLRDHLLDALSTVGPRTATVPFFSTVTGGLLEGTALDTRYWWRNARQTVLFEPALRALLDAGHRTFIEVNPHPLLRSALEETFDAADVTAAAVGTLHRDEAPRTRVTQALAEVYRLGHRVDWRAAGTAGRLTTLPSYAFQHRRFWPQPGPAAVPPGNSTGHPVLTTVLALPHIGGHLLTGRLSPHDLPWLTDHALRGEALVPGTLLAELACTAARLTGGGQVGELVLETPLRLPADAGTVSVHIAVDAPGEDGSRTVSIHARPAAADPDGPWTRHAHGTVTPSTPEPPACPRSPWPPAPAEPVDLTGAYDRLRRTGYEYGPAFRGLRALWRSEEAVFADVALDEGQDPNGFAVHPALLDMALHPILLTRADTEDTSVAHVPFSWSTVRLHQAGATAARVSVYPAGDHTYTLHVTDPAGRPVADATLTFRPVSSPVPDLRYLDWTPTVLRIEGPLGAGTAVLGAPHPALPAVPACPDIDSLIAPAPVGGAHVPRIVVVHQQPDNGDETGLPARVRGATARHLRILRTLLTDPRYAASRLVLSTSRATTDTPDLVAAAVTGLWRSAAAEHPGQVALVDRDGTPASDRLLPAAVAAGQAQLALRDGIACTPRLQTRTDGDVITAPDRPGPWKLAPTESATTSTPDDLALVPAPEYDRDPGPGEVTVAVRAAGLNFVDVITTMGLFPGTAGLGREFAGRVTAVGAGVTRLAPGDRVMGIVGLSDSAVAPTVVTDARLVARVPGDWSWAEAAGVPIAYLTAYYWVVMMG